MIFNKSVQKSAEFVSKNAHHVRIHLESIRRVSIKLMNLIKEENYDQKAWKRHPLNPKTLTEETVNWIFVCDLLNFSFWPNEEGRRYTVVYNDTAYSGYWGMCAALNQANDKGKPLHNFEIVSKMNFEEFVELMKPVEGEELVLMSERFKMLQDAANIMLSKYNGKFVDFIEQVKGDVYLFLNRLIEEFPSFNDAFKYKGRKIYLLKRAQILIADLWACFEGKSFGEFKNINEITMFADYRIPQILFHWNVLEYSEDLLNRLNNKELLESGSEMEIEIRGCSIYALELIRGEIAESFPDVNSVILDFFLWDFVDSHRDEFNSIPFHRTRSIYY